MVEQKKYPTISVVLSTYNGRDTWLRKAIDSVYSQTFKEFELIIINDGSTNNVEEVITEYIKKYNNIIYIRNKKNLGFTKSLNIGIENSHGKYIARVDDDDYWISEDKLEKQFDFMENNKEYGLCGAGKIVHIDENDKILFTEYKNRLSDDEIRKDMLLQCWITHSSVLIRREAIDKVGMYDQKYVNAQDYELWLRIGKEYKLVNLEDVSIAYRVRTNSLSKSGKHRMFKAIFSDMVRKNKKNYPGFIKATILKIGVFIIGRNTSLYIRRKINPKLAVKEVELKNFKKNILVLNYEFPPLGGGASTVSYDISRGYVEAGYNVDVITMGFKNLPKYENIEGINIYRVKCIRNKKKVCYPYEQLTYLISGYLKIKELLKTNKYDICHCHFLIPTGILALIIKKFFGLKYFITSHGSDVPGHNPNRFKIAHKFTPKLLKIIINNAEAVISPSKYLANLIKKNVKGINKDVEIIPNGIDIQQFIPLKKEKIIIGTGRLWPLKGLHLLAEAFSEIETTNGFELHICGDGPLMDKLKRVKAKSKNKIILHGWIENNSKEYKELLGKAMIYCLPSVSESGSLSILEGMSCEAAIITTDMGVCSEMAKDIGFYVEPNVKSLKKQLEYLIKNKKICEEAGKKSRIKVINNYDKKDVIGKYINICETYL